MYTVGDWMTRDVVSLRETDDLVAATTLFKLGRIRHLPVVRGGKLVGLITQRDVLRATAGKTSAHARKTLAKDLMHTRLRTVSTTTPLRQAAREMLREKIGCLPVVGAEKRLLGIITEADVVRLAAHMLDDLDKLDELALRAVRATKRRR